MISKNLFQDAKEISEYYRNAQPFPHIIIDNFLQEDILDIVLREMQNYDAWSHDTQIPQYQVNKYYTPATDTDEDTARSLGILEQKSPITYATLKYLYSKDAMQFLSELTGIENLQSDPSWFGAGVHKVRNSGKLAVHADFNLNWKINKYRRINLLLYMNKDWKDEYNGHLELWERDMSACAGKIAPVFNRAVIFNTDRTSYHGHTVPLNVPPEVSRYSLALYYYTDTPPPDDEEQRFVTWKNSFA